MSDMKETTKYEFCESENLMLSALSRNLKKLGVVVLAAGLLFVAYLIVSFIDPVPLMSISDTKHALFGIVDWGLWGVIAVLVIYMSITLIRLAGPIGQIVKSSGADIAYLMHFTRDLTRMAGVAFIALIVVCLLLAVSLVFLVLIF
jgi:hypothetical protein